MTYLTNCVNSDCESITNMTDTSREITLRTFLRHVSRQEVSALLGYDRYLPISRDWCVRFHKGTYQGMPCYYVVHSAIEYIFTNQGVPNDL